MPMYTPNVKKLLWAFSIPILLTFVLFAWAPFFVRAYVERNYPGVTVGDAALRWQFVALTNVRIQRPNVQALIRLATVDWEGNAVLYGGHIHLSLEENPEKSSGPSETSSIRGQGLVVHVTKGSLTADLEDVAFDSAQVDFRSGQVTQGLHQATLTEGSLDRRSKVAYIKRVTAPIRLPFEAPKIAQNQLIEATDVVVDPSNKRVTLGSAKIGETLQVKQGQAYTKEGVLYLELGQLEVKHPWVSPDLVTFKKAKVESPLNVIDGQGMVTVTLGEAKILVDPQKWNLSGVGSCNAWVEAMPTPMPKALQETRGHFTGDLSFDIELDPAPQLRVKNSCKFECKYAPIQALKMGQVTYLAYTKRDNLFSRTIGPQIGGWTVLANLPPHIPNAFIALEDPGFLHHRGVIPQALENSLKDNVRMGRFFRGGSTITMQLVKNLWLQRHKTLSRKAMEVLLTSAMESCLTKAEILELYLNVVEFGPDLYGIGPASQHYFEHGPERLEPEEAFYLASILPRPRKAIPPKSGGLDRTRALMRTLAGRGLINDALVPLEQSADDTWITE